MSKFHYGCNAPAEIRTQDEVLEALHDIPFTTGATRQMGFEPIASRVRSPECNPSYTSGATHLVRFELTACWTATSCSVQAELQVHTKKESLFSHFEGD